MVWTCWPSQPEMLAPSQSHLLQSGSKVRWKKSGAWCSCGDLLLARISSSVLQITGQMDFSLALVQAGLSGPEIQGPPSQVQPILSYPCDLFGL